MVSGTRRAEVPTPFRPSRVHAAAGVALLPLAAVLLYSFRILPPAVARRVGFARIKEILVLKNVWVAATLAGKSFASERWDVKATGEVVKTGL